MSMRLRLILSFVLIVIASIASVVIIVRRGTIVEVHAFIFRGGMLGNEKLVISLEQYYQVHQSWQGVEMIFEQPGLVDDSMGGMMRSRYRLADAQGSVVLDTAAIQKGGKLAGSEMALAITLYNDKQVIGYLLPEGAMLFANLDESRLLQRLDRAALIGGLIAGGMSLLLALMLAYSLLRPIRELTAAAGRMAQGDLTQRVSAQGSDELSVLARTFNHMADSLQSAEDSRRAMTADIAHELRNPLAVQRANLEALQDGVYPLNPENLVPLLEQNHMLSRLVDDLRTLALADAGQLIIERKPVDVIALFQHVIERYRPQAGAQLVEINLLFPQSGLPQLQLDPLRMEQIMGNLLTNALRYAPEGGHVDVEIQNFGDRVEISVHDNGPGIPGDALPHIFERFYRADRSRSRSEGGTGLGLAIGRKFAEALGGNLVAANHPAGGAMFTLSLPITK